ncbi:hypothetical protein SGLAU_32650 (plasmid) [Streptomyces glaucescens]|uniref:Uncharacterized protein n=1 Tax=Streptomyces glaucescens TaxID=1907 RepID=A0A089XKI0_STRGA|nr:hypothetical protein SGLAU_32650 [Streptomyces glaucescens]
MNVCSPRPRGWSRGARPATARPRLLPAPAGMVPRSPTTRHSNSAAPRARGDGPPRAGPTEPGEVCSPRPRGWSRQPGDSLRSTHLLPAPAGMVPRRTTPRATSSAAPRARGDGPDYSLEAASWSSCSPRPRGWSSKAAGQVPDPRLLPAPAGMVPASRTARAERCTAPRARGDGPSLPGRLAFPGRCSPRPRGWSQPAPRTGRADGLLPAPAGMVPGSREAMKILGPAPRARGDGPQPARPRPPSPHCSPRPRGWSRAAPAVRGRRQLLPAPAGMVPKVLGLRRVDPPAPRARGDGPRRQHLAAFSRRCSPRPGGWPQAADDAVVVAELLPAPAGMSQRRVPAARRPRLLPAPAGMVGCR